MKLFKKMTSILLAVAVCATTAFAAFPAMAETSTADNSTAGNGSSVAESTYTLTIKNTGETAHTFELYQIFTGDLSETKDTGADGKTTTTRTLSNITWGNGVTEAGRASLGDADAYAKKIVNESDATSFANDLVKGENGTSYLQQATESSAVAANESYKFENLTAGYYLVKDRDNSQGVDSKDAAGGAYTLFVLKVVGDATAETKLGVPTVEKKVQDTNDSTGEKSKWQDSADYDIGDDISYQITGTMPSNIVEYTTYKYEFTDTMSKGLTYTANNAKIKIGDTDVTSSFTEAVTPKEDGSTVVTWSCDNLKGIKGVTLDKNTKVVVTYTAQLNKNAVIGSVGNPNTVNLTFSNNPNKGGEGDTGKTPDDKNIVFTYKVVVNKVDQDKKALAGAEFTLSKVKSDKTTEVVKTFTLTGDKEKDPTIFTASGLDDGTYVLKETKTPAGYNTIKDQYFTITAKHDETADKPTLTSLSGNKLDGSAQTTITFTADMEAGSLTTDVVNNKGINLPTTGGMGTRVLYAGGAAMILVGSMIIRYVIKRLNAR